MVLGWGRENYTKMMLNYATESDEIFRNSDECSLEGLRVIRE